MSATGRKFVVVTHAEHEAYKRLRKEAAALAVSAPGPLAERVWAVLDKQPQETEGGGGASDPCPCGGGGRLHQDDCPRNKEPQETSECLSPRNPYSRHWYRRGVGPLRGPCYYCGVSAPRRR